MSSHSPIKLGFVGLSTRGWASTAHAAALFHPSLSSTYSLTALQTTSEKSAAAAKELYKDKVLDGVDLKAYHGNGATDIAEDPNVEVVVISVNAPDHRSAFNAAIAFGKHVFVEYPPGKNLQESLEMRAAANRKGNLHVAVGLQGVQSTVIRKVKQVLDAGAIGKVRSTTVIGNIPRESRFWQPESTTSVSYALDKTNGVTFLNIVGGHHFGSFLHLLGTFDSIGATGSIQYPTTSVFDSLTSKEVVKTVKSTSFDHYSISGALKSGAHASITWRSGYKNVPGRLQFLWIIDGEEGTIRLESDSTTPPGSLMNIANPKVTVNGQPLDDYYAAQGLVYADPDLVVEDGEKGTTVEFVRREWVEFAKVIRGADGEVVTLDDAIEVQKVVEAVEKSAELGGLSVKIV